MPSTIRPTTRRGADLGTAARPLPPALDRFPLDCPTCTGPTGVRGTSCRDCVVRAGGGYRRAVA